eukprot:TRINITY_DN34775_c0_g1_i1.p1 TRINITY_DN34775_c0_g1~~TRINITY_DN34775_c0_g1_i1.p1  ORF type:complete len:584 (+),score=137.10 TRINITY_DN34775_c0_g1_i1:67-1752(+)
MPPVAELTFRRAMINLTDAGRLGEGEDLNDALLDFFVRLGQALIPKGGEDKAPVSYLGAVFFKQLRSAFSTSGEEGWKNVQNWAKRKAGGLFKPSYAAFCVPINEDLKDEKGQDAGNHWWLALVLNPHGGARKESTAVMCLDSMQRREKIFDEPAMSYLKSSVNRYSVAVKKVEQAGYLVIISFTAKGDGSMGALQRPQASRLIGDGVECRNPELGLRINMAGGDDLAGEFDGTLSFSLDGRIRTSRFELHYGEGGYSPIKFEFDPFSLTKLQKDVSRFIGGYLAKEWEVNGPDRKVRYEKQSARALVADVHQQENLNDCGVFVLENTLRSLRMKNDFLRQMATATPAVLKSFPWPSQAEITTRKAKLKAIVARLFAAGAEKGTGDVEKLLKDDDVLKADVVASLTEEQEEALDKWANDLKSQLASRQVDKMEVEAEIKRKEEAAQARREEERAKKEEELRKAEEIRLQGKRPPGSRRSPTPKKKDSDKDKKKKKPQKKKRQDSREDDYSEEQASSCERRGKKKSKAKPKSKKRPPSDDSRGGADSRDASESPPPRKRGRR